jgi:hypothetical protein
VHRKNGGTQKVRSLQRPWSQRWRRTKNCDFGKSACKAHLDEQAKIVSLLVPLKSRCSVRCQDPLLLCQVKRRTQLRITLRYSKHRHSTLYHAAPQRLGRHLLHRRFWAQARTGAGFGYECF